MENIVKRTVPSQINNLARSTGLVAIYKKIRSTKYYYLGRAYKPGETSKARQRRIREGFFLKYCQGTGLDIGYGGDLLAKNCRGWDYEHGDAQYLQGINESEYDFVYSSHTLEHLPFPEVAILNWWNVLKPGGYLILYVPHRDLYEKKTTLPSRWTPEHKHFFLLDRDEQPNTIGMIPFLNRNLSNHEIVEAKVCSEGHSIQDPEIHSDGEYSIEVIIRKVQPL